MAGFLLARAGVSVVVLEKYVDFFRDFRGDTIHPSTLEVMSELGILDEFLRLPSQKVNHISGRVGPDRLSIADFSRLPVAAPFIAMMPQWDFLNFLASHAKPLAGFRLEMHTSADSLIEEGGKVVGVRATGAQGPLEVHASLTIGADGRHSTLRELAGLKVRDLGAPMDVLWFGLPREDTDGGESIGRFDRGSVFVMINRDSYWQCGFVIPKGTIEAVRAAGLASFHSRIAALLPFDGGIERTGSIITWEQVKLLTVTVDRLDTWYKPGLLMIGDAAHAMSPIGGVGVNLAIQDAVAVANLLAAPLRAGILTVANLAAVQRRRLWPARVTQRLQVLAQNRLVGVALAGDRQLRAPWVIRALTKTALFRGLIGRLIGMGVRPEHVRPS